MNCVAQQCHSVSQSPSQREWLASIALSFALREGSTRLIGNKHSGPLRVQRAFYPESKDCCHVYLLHPPGGLVIGDVLQISVDVQPSACALLTTPSAGKIYGAKGASELQQQRIHFSVAEHASLEWLPQETIVFNSANGVLQTRVDLCGNARYCGWDIVRLGRVASGESFEQGRCVQNLEIFRDSKPLFIERNVIDAGATLHRSVCGLQSRNTLGSLVATVDMARDFTDDLCAELDNLSGDSGAYWGLTQKEHLFIARYLGDDVALCRKGFELIWRAVRPNFNQRKPVPPRIWAT